MLERGTEENVWQLSKRSKIFLPRFQYESEAGVWRVTLCLLCLWQTTKRKGQIENAVHLKLIYDDDLHNLLK